MKSNIDNNNWGDLIELSYYAQGLLDLEDIVNTLNSMIEKNVPKFDRGNLKKICNVSTIPLKNRNAGMIVIVKVPSIVLADGRNIVKL